MTDSNVPLETKLRVIIEDFMRAQRQKQVNDLAIESEIRLLNSRLDDMTEMLKDLLDSI